MSKQPKVKYYSSSPQVPAPNYGGVISHGVYMEVVQDGCKQTIRVATCIDANVSKRIAELLDKAEGQ